jgi:iron complex outermembrane receptor protein
MPRLRSRGGGVALAFACLALASPVRADELLAHDLADLSLEQLANVVVTSVSRRSERLSDVSASIYVITAEDIRRSGAGTLPQALRLAPNLQVARADANQWAVSARGFNSVLTNKLLVLIDGRTVYSPLFSGTFWEVQDLLLDDVDRIEVVSGPGGTMWGTNAVNGVINIITKSALETEGAVLRGGWGNTTRAAAGRIGGELGKGFHARAWGKFVEQDHYERGDRSDIFDNSDRRHGGVRLDWEKGSNAFTVEGGGYDEDIAQAIGVRQLQGWHLLGRWARQTDAASSMQVQAYYDRTDRDQPGSLIDALDTWDVEFQHGFRPLAAHDVFWGAGYRYQWDAVDNTNPGTLAFVPDDRALRTIHVFAEDGIRLTRQLHADLGIKAEHNVYTGWEVLPTLRFSLKPRPSHLLWGSLSRAVRAPSRIDRDFFVPGTPPYLLAGGPDFVSEVSRIAELGYRGQPSPAVTLALTTFIHEHERLRSLEPGPDGPEWGNKIHGTTRGVEGWLRWRVRPSWALTAGGVAQRQRLALDSDGNDLGGLPSLGNDPDFWYGVRSALDVGPKLEIDAAFRRVGRLPLPYVPAYSTMDLRLAWWLRPAFELAVTGRNLFERSHPEWGLAPGRAEVARSVFVALRWRSR